MDTVEEIKANLSSVEEKEKQFMENSHIEKWLFVAELSSALMNEKLKPSDWIQTNSNGNLVIMREFDNYSKMIAVIEFHRSTIEFYLEELLEA